jgi:hypothetical protein
MILNDPPVHPDLAPRTRKGLGVPGLACASVAGRREDALRELKVAARLSPADVKVHWRLAALPGDGKKR